LTSIQEIKVEDDQVQNANSPRNKSVQNTPKNTKSPKQQPNVSQQKQLPPPASVNQKASPPSPPLKNKGIANPSKIPVVVPSKNIATPVS